MRTIIFLVAFLLSGLAYAGADCSNYGGTSLAGCSAQDFTVDRTQDHDADQWNTTPEPEPEGDEPVEESPA